MSTQLKLKKSKSLGPFWSYQLKSTANSAHFAQFLGSPKTATRILIFSIAMGADVSTIETLGFYVFQSNSFKVMTTVYVSSGQTWKHAGRAS